MHLPELFVLAELMGYKLESFAICPNLQNLNEGVKIEITCYKSGIRSVLRAKNQEQEICNCPPVHSSQVCSKIFCEFFKLKSYFLILDLHG